MKLNRIKKYLLTIPFIIPILSTIFFNFAFDNAHQVLIEQKIADSKFNIDIICDEANLFIAASNDNKNCNYSDILSSVISRIDATDKIYAELFDYNLNGISNKTPLYHDLNFDPRNYKEFIQNINSNKYGELSIMFDSNLHDPHNMYIYYRWIYDDIEPNNNMLIVIGISKYSIDVSFSDWIARGTLALIIISSISAIWAIIMYCLYSSHDIQVNNKADDRKD